MTRIDPHHHEERYKRWKQQEAIRNVSPENAEIILRFLRDMELGLNVSSMSKRGPRSYMRLNTLRVRIPMLARRFEERFAVGKVTDVTEEQVLTLFSQMRSGVIRRSDGGTYTAVADFVKDFKGFWHWYMTAQRKQGNTVPDITLDLDSRQAKPKWVYLTEEQVSALCNVAKYEYRVLMRFLLDSGIRSPTELVNLRVADFEEGFSRVHVREETSKTFGRRIRLLLSSRAIEEYVRAKRLQPQDRVFPISPVVANRYLRRLATRVFGEDVSLGGERYSRLTLYDFRHISACFWLPRYKSESALKYRFGWKRTERIHYYTELLGMKDSITEDDLVIDDDKTALERRLAQAERDKALLQERLDSLQRQMEQIAAATDKLLGTANVA